MRLAVINNKRSANSRPVIRTSHESENVIFADENLVKVLVPEISFAGFCAKKDLLRKKSSHGKRPFLERGKKWG